MNLLKKALARGAVPHMSRYKSGRHRTPVVAQTAGQRESSPSRLMTMSELQQQRRSATPGTTGTLLRGAPRSLRCRPPAAGRKMRQDKLVKLPEAQLCGNPSPALTPYHSSPPENWTVADSAASPEKSGPERLADKFSASQKPATTWRYLDEYSAAALIGGDADGPLFRTTAPEPAEFSNTTMADACTGWFIGSRRR
jgi:hypothetical protein